MSTVFSISALLDALVTSQGDKNVRDAVNSWLSGPAAKVKKSKSKASKNTSSSDGESSSAEDGASKPKKPGPDAWNAYINHLCGPKDAPTPGFTTWLAEQPDGLKGNKRMIYAKHMKSTNGAAYDSFKAAFKPSVSSASSTTSTESASKPKRKPGRPPKATETTAATKTAAPKKVAKKKTAELPVLPESDTEDDLSSCKLIELYEQDFFWDSDEGVLYEVNEDGSRGKQCGNYDGSTANFH